MRRYLYIKLTLILIWSALPLRTASAQSKIYWTESGGAAPKIRVAELLDPSQPSTLYSTADGVVDPGPIVVDPINSDLYWIDKGSDIVKLVKGKTDGSSAPITLITADSGSSTINFSTIEHLSIDTTNSKIYWSDSGRNRVQRANLDGTNVEEVLGSVSSPQGLHVDVSSQLLYRAGSATLTKLDLSSGSQSEQVVLSSSNFPNLSATALHYNDGVLYWQNTQSTAYGIYSVPVSGGTVSQLDSISISHVIKAIGISAKHQKLYYVNNSSSEITEIDLSDNSATAFLTSANHGVDRPIGVAIEVGCPDDLTKDSPGVCGCGTPDVDADSDGVIDCVELPVLSPGFEIEEPPTVNVTGRQATITMQEFSDVTLSSNSLIGAERIQLKASRLNIKYQVTVTPADLTSNRRNDIRRRLTKRNEITFRNIPPGNYTTRYRVLIVRKKKTVGRSTFSPSESFSIDEASD